MTHQAAARLCGSFDPDAMPATSYWIRLPVGDAGRLLLATRVGVPPALASGEARA
ncbi:MAG: hypothetical protein JO037_17855, partial [Actinobacteria bacterium]|nr:hypothetical protein [Actinomycetota bacterium]